MDKFDFETYKQIVKSPRIFKHVDHTQFAYWWKTQDPKEDYKLHNLIGLIDQDKITMDVIQQDSQNIIRDQFIMFNDPIGVYNDSTLNVSILRAMSDYHQDIHTRKLTDYPAYILRNHYKTISYMSKDGFPNYSNTLAMLAYDRPYYRSSYEYNHELVLDYDSEESDDDN